MRESEIRSPHLPSFGSPAQFHALYYPGPPWWFLPHMIQSPIVALVAVGLWLRAGRLDAQDGKPALLLAWLSRVATFVFMIFYTMDSIGGSGLGRTIHTTESLKPQGQLTPGQLQGVILLPNTHWVDSWVGGVGSFVSLTGSWAAFAAALLMALPSSSFLPPARAAGRLGAAAGVRLGAADEPHHAARADRLRRLDRRDVVAAAGEMTPGRR